MEPVQRPICVVSDAHLGASDPESERLKSRRLLAFWKYVEEQEADLVVLGDLFDFWFEYRHAVPRAHFEHLTALRHLVEAGRRVWYVAGNHDFWIGPFLRDELGVAFHPDELKVTRHGRAVLFAHGDGWLPGEHGYRLMKRVLRNRTAIWMFRMVSPDLGFPLARWVSRRSRGRHALDSGKFADYARVAYGRLGAGIDLLITAHLHECRHLHWPGGDWLLTGDWIRHFSFAMVDANEPRLLRWRDDGAHVAEQAIKAAEPAKA
jgi:UDP-2,3-diacylglucosamine hydrolase